MAGKVDWKVLDDLTKKGLSSDNIRQLDQTVHAATGSVKGKGKANDSLRTKLAQSAATDLGKQIQNKNPTPKVDLDAIKRKMRYNMQGIDPNYKAQKKGFLKNLTTGNPVASVKGLAGNVGDVLSPKNPDGDMSNWHRLDMGKKKAAIAKKLK